MEIVVEIFKILKIVIKTALACINFLQAEFFLSKKPKCEITNFSIGNCGLRLHNKSERIKSIPTLIILDIILTFMPNFRALHSIMWSLTFNLALKIRSSLAFGRFHLFSLKQCSLNIFYYASKILWSFIIIHTPLSICVSSSPRRSNFYSIYKSEQYKNLRPFVNK